MEREEALNTLMKMRAWRKWGKEQKEEERPEMPEQKEVDEAFDVCIKLLQSSLPSNLDEAAERILSETYPQLHNGSFLTEREMVKLIIAGAKWMAGQGVTVKGLQYGGNLGIPDIPKEFYTDKQEEVIVQIRKK